MPDGAPTPLAKKLGIKPRSSLCILGDRAPWLLDVLPDVELRRRLSNRHFDVVVLFCRDSASMQRSVGDCAKAVFPAGSLWIAWPRRAAGHHSDLRDNSVRQTCLRIGMVDVKVAALSVDWSGLKVVWHKELRGSPRDEQQ